MYACIYICIYVCMYVCFLYMAHTSSQYNPQPTMGASPMRPGCLNFHPLVLVPAHSRPFESRHIMPMVSWCESAFFVLASLSDDDDGGGGGGGEMEEDAVDW